MPDLIQHAKSTLLEQLEASASNGVPMMANSLWLGNMPWLGVPDSLPPSMASMGMPAFPWPGAAVPPPWSRQAMLQPPTLQQSVSNASQSNETQVESTKAPNASPN